MSKSALSAKHFHDEEAAFAYIEARLWPEGPICPHCGGEGYSMKPVIGKASVRKDGSVKPAPRRLGVKKCRACQVQFTVRVGTVFEDSRAPLHLWLQAIVLLAASKKGISSNQLHRTLGVTLKTAWHMSHRLRMAMAPLAGSLPPMGGEGKIVELDETYHGAVQHPAEYRKDTGKPLKKGKRGRYDGPANKRPIVALVERGGSARVFHVAEANAATVSKIIRENVDRKSKIHTDGSNIYTVVGKEFADHSRVEHSRGEYVRYEEGGAIHNNNCEAYFSVLKKGLDGVYQHVAEKNLHRYLSEFSFRYNNRVALGVDDQERAETLLQGVKGKRLTYRTTGRPT